MRACCPNHFAKSRLNRRGSASTRSAIYDGPSLTAGGAVRLPDQSRAPAAPRPSAAPRGSGHRLHFRARRGRPVLRPQRKRGRRDQCTHAKTGGRCRARGKRRRRQGENGEAPFHWLQDASKVTGAANRIRCEAGAHLLGAALSMRGRYGRKESGAHAQAGSACTVAASPPRG